MSKLQKKLWPFFDAKTSMTGNMPDLASDRYLPRAFSAAGPGWGVFDRKLERFLSDKEVVNLPTVALMSEKLCH